jgi:8-oxo-dGTP pyrophosphatase MutT (NUDIX family)
MPGGALEVGETPAQGVVREVLEETGVSCQPVALLGVFDSRLCGLPTRHHLYLLTFLCRPIEGTGAIPPSHAIEVLDVCWFQQDDLPDDLHPGTGSRLEQVFGFWRNQSRAFFDP